MISDMTDIEQWRTAVYDGEVYEGLYKVSNLGRILSLNYKNTGKPGLMTPFDNGYGYLQVELCKNKETKHCFVHRLVGEAFLPNPDNLPEINHIDEDKTNNRVDNLEWKNHRDNLNHGTHNERMAKTKSKPVLQLTLTGELIREWESTNECGRNGFNQGAVAACCRGEKPQYKGFLWMYADDYKEKQLQPDGCLPLW